MFTVLNLDDDGPGSLRRAVRDANAADDPDVIAFAAGLRGTITLTGGQLSVLADLTIDGPGAELPAVSGNEQSRVFHVAAGASVTVDDLTVTRGRDASAVYARRTEIAGNFASTSHDDVFGDIEWLDP